MTIIMDCVFPLIENEQMNMIITSAQMVIKVKRRQLQRQQRQNNRSTNNAQSSSKNRTEGSTQSTSQQ